MAHVKLNKKNPFIYRIVGDLEGNALDCVVLEPMYAIFAGLITFYQPLYMKSLGVTEVQMGMLNSLLAVCAVVTSLIAGPITDRMGRKKSTLYFDYVAWTVPMAVWAISQNFWYFFIAVLFNSFSKVPYTSWTCLTIEDTPEDKRVLFFSLL